MLGMADSWRDGSSGGAASVMGAGSTEVVDEPDSSDVGVRRRAREENARRRGYVGVRKNLFDLRRAATIQNLEAAQRLALAA